MKKYIFLVMTFLLFTGCLFDIENKESKEEVTIAIEWPQTTSAIEKNISRQLHPSTVSVDITLRNVITGKEYNVTVAKGSSSGPSEVTIKDVIIGQYQLIMDSYDSGGTLLARIEDNLSVGSGGTSYQGVFGKPDEVSSSTIYPSNGAVLTSSALIYLEWDSVSSNYEAVDATLDDITYEVYMGTSAGLTSSNLLTLSSTPTSTTEGALLSVLQSELTSNNIPLDNGTIYYWKVVAKTSTYESSQNADKYSTESDTWMFTYLNPTLFTSAETKSVEDMVASYSPQSMTLSGTSFYENAIYVDYTWSRGYMYIEYYKEAGTYFVSISGYDNDTPLSVNPFEASSMSALNTALLNYLTQFDSSL